MIFFFAAGWFWAFCCCFVLSPVKKKRDTKTRCVYKPRTCLLYWTETMVLVSMTKPPPHCRFFLLSPFQSPPNYPRKGFNFVKNVLALPHTERSKTADTMILKITPIQWSLHDSTPTLATRHKALNQFGPESNFSSIHLTMQIFNMTVIVAEKEKVFVFNVAFQLMEINRTCISHTQKRLCQETTLVTNNGPTRQMTASIYWFIIRQL